jgi:hypothetical protein
MWLLLHFTRLMTIVRRASNQPIGYVGSAVMLNAKLKPKVSLMHVIAMTRRWASACRRKARIRKSSAGPTAPLPCHLRIRRRPPDEVDAAAPAAARSRPPMLRRLLLPCLLGSLSLGTPCAGLRPAPGGRCVGGIWGLLGAAPRTGAMALAGQNGGFARKPLSLKHAKEWYEPRSSLDVRPRRQDLDGWPDGGVARRQDPRADPHAALRLRRLRRRARLQHRKGTAIFRLQEHTERLFNSAKILRMQIPFTQEQVNQAQVDVVKANQLKSCYLRPLTWIGDRKLGVSPRATPST